MPIIMWNPPWLLIWIYPLFWLPFLTAAQAWLIVNAALILLSATLIWKTPARGPDQRHTECACYSPPLAIAWVAAMIFVPALQTLRMGQISSIILLGVAGFLYFAARERSVLAGIFLALTSIKPHVVYLVWMGAAWWVIWQRRWGFVVGVLATLLPTLLVLTFVWPAWPAGYQEAMSQPPLYWETATLGGILRELIFTETPQAQFLPPVLGAVCFGVYLLWRRLALDWQNCLGPVLLVSVPTAAYGWGFDQVVLLVPYLQIVLWLFEKDTLTNRDQVATFVGLVLVECGIAAVYMLSIPAQYLFWAPWALGAVYLYALLQRRASVAAGSVPA
jgi:hypothetical protein